MANIVSPGVYVIEKDISNYPATIDSTTVGIVGFAEKGPTNKATLITSQERLVDTFGEPVELLGQGVLAGLEILEASNRIYFVRAVDDNAQEASAVVPFGFCPAIAVSAAEIGVTQAVEFKVQVTDNTGASGFPFVKTYSVTTKADSTQFKQLAAAFGTDLDGLKVAAAFPYETDGNGIVVPTAVTTDNETAHGFIVGAFAGSGATLTVSASQPVLMKVGVSGGVYASASKVGYSQLTVSGGTIDTSSLRYVVESLYPGAGYNQGLKADGTVSGNSIEVDPLGGSKFSVILNDKGALKESFKTSLLDGSLYLTDVIDTGKSDYIKGAVQELGAEITPEKLASFATDITGFIKGASVSGLSGTAAFSGTPRFVKLVQGTYPLSGGNNGINKDDYEEFAIGNPQEKTGLYALDDDQLNLTIGLVPGLTSQNVQNALITLAETSQNFIACVAPPYLAADTPQEAIDWSNGLSETRTAAINSSYAAIYWPWVKTFVPTTGEDKWLDPAIYGARQIAYTAGVSELWFAPAGFVRGRLTKPTQVQSILNQGDRDSLYSGGNAINPIVNFPQQGITIFGQRTAQRDPTALDRINVRMLMIYIRKVLLLSTQRFAFEPNDAILWSQIQETVNPLLDDIKRRRGITEFKVVCDETVNTPLRVDRNEVWCKILIKPTKAAEAVVFELNITSQSAKISG